MLRTLWPQEWVQHGSALWLRAAARAAEPGSGSLKSTAGPALHARTISATASACAPSSSSPPRQQRLQPHRGAQQSQYTPHHQQQPRQRQQEQHQQQQHGRRAPQGSLARPNGSGGSDRRPRPWASRDRQEASSARESNAEHSVDQRSSNYDGDSNLHDQPLPGADNGRASADRRRRAPPAKDWSRPHQRRNDAGEQYSGASDKGKGRQRHDSTAGGVPSSIANANRKRKEKHVREVRAQDITMPLPPFITLSDLSKVLDVKLRMLQNKMMHAGYQDTRPDLTLPFADAEILALEFNVTATLQSTSSADFDIFPRPRPQDASMLPLRPPVITIMGHVDHGKTTLLDKLRSASVAAGEAGGITQHVGAFSVEVKGLANSQHGLNTITFIDTPGHAAFTKMRSRGAKVTDIVVLVVAADDGVMPQTKEVLAMVREVQEEEAGRVGRSDSTDSSSSSSGLQLVVALSKIDKAEADLERVKRELLSEGVQLEEFGGEVPCVEISGKTGAGLDKLEETLVALSELNELRAEKVGVAEGYVIESRVEKGFGNTAVVLIKRGSLKVGGYCVAGSSWCKVRRLMDSSGKTARKEGIPGDALLVTGWRTLPNAGDLVLGVEDNVDGYDAEELVKKCIDTRLRIEERRRLVQDVEAINRGRRDEALERERSEIAAAVERKLVREARIRGEEYAPNAEKEAANDAAEADTEKGADLKELRLIVKADYSGTVEAVVGAISGIGNREVHVKIVSAGVGEPNDSDLARAQAVGGHILGFNVKANRSLQNAAAKLEPRVMVHCDDVIYRLMTYVSEQCVALLPPVVEARVVGEATIQEVFSINVRSRVFRNVAGCRITNGSVSRNQLVRVMRPNTDAEDAAAASNDGKPSRRIVYEGRLDSLKHVKKEVDEMRKGTECGMSFADNFQQFQKGDVVQCFYRENVPRTL